MIRFSVVVTLVLIFPLVGQSHGQTTAETATSKGRTDASSGNFGGRPTTPDVGDRIKGTRANPGTEVTTVCSVPLSVSAESAAEFRRVVGNDGATFIYVNLEFMDVDFTDSLAAYLSDDGNVINPLRWVWANGGKGNLLLSSPFDFKQLSLTTLSTGVSSVDVKIRGCLEEAQNDTKNVESIAELLWDSVRDQSNQTEDGTDNEMLICLEKQLGKDEFRVPGVFHFPAASYYMKQASSAYDCWPADKNSKVKRFVPTQYWLGWILAGGVVLALFSPLAFSFFIQNKPERVESGVERLSLDSDLPLGLKYVLCFWRNDNFCIASTRWSVFVLVFMLIQYIPVFVSFVTDREDFEKRFDAFSRVGPINVTLGVAWHVIVNLIFFIASVVLLEKFIRPSGQQFLDPLLRERARSTISDTGCTPTRGDETGDVAAGEGQGKTTSRVEGQTSVDVQDEDEDEDQVAPSDSGNMLQETNGQREGSTHSQDDAVTTNVHVEEYNVAYKHIVLVEAPKDLWAPVTSLVSSKAFFYYMGWRAKMLLNLKAWKFVLYGWLWERISELVGGPNNPRTVLCGVIFALLYLLYLPLALIFFGFNSFPLLYCMTRCIQTALGNDVKCSELMFALLISLASVFWIFKFVATFVYFAELIGYTFMGFVVNAEVVAPTIIVVLAFAGYILRAITSFYDGYCVLFTKVTGIAEDMKTGDSETLPEKHVTASVGGRPSYRQRSAAGNTIPMTRLGGGATASGGQSSPAPASAPKHPLVAFSSRGVPSLELHLFWLIVEKYRPIRIQVAKTFLKLLVIAVVIGFGMSILALANSISDLPTVVDLVGSVIIAGVVPTVLLAVDSPASQERIFQARERQMKTDIARYAQKGTFE